VAVQYQTKLMPRDCVAKMQEHVAPPRFEHGVVGLGWSCGYTGEGPLLGTVTQDGFSVFRRPKKLGFPSIRISGSFLQEGAGAVIRLQSRLTGHGRAGLLWVPLAITLVFLLPGLMRFAGTGDKGLLALTAAVVAPLVGVSVLITFFQLREERASAVAIIARILEAQ